MKYFPIILLLVSLVWTTGGFADDNVLRGTVKNAEGEPVPGALVRIAIPEANMMFVHSGTLEDQYEATTNQAGEYEITFPTPLKETTASMDVLKRGYMRLVGRQYSGGDAKSVEIKPGEDASADLVLKHPSDYFAGTVVDLEGNPVSGVEFIIGASANGGGYGVERTGTNEQGEFEFFCMPAKPEGLGIGPARIYAVTNHPDYLSTTVGDFYELAGDEPTKMKIVVDPGVSVSGTVVDELGNPVPGVIVRVRSQDMRQQKGVRSGGLGDFAFSGVAPGANLFSSIDHQGNRKGELAVKLTEDRGGIVLKLDSFKIPDDLVTHEVLGMTVTNNTAELAKTYNLHQNQGVLILDPGINSDQLGVGELAKGDFFWMVGQERISNVREFVTGLLKETENPLKVFQGVRVVFSMHRVDYDASNTQYITVSFPNREKLKTLLAELPE